MSALTRLLADGTASGGGGDLPPWLQWGVLGLVITGFVTKLLVPGWMYGDVRSENQDLKAENKRLVQLVLDTQHETIPALGAAAKATEEAMAEIRLLRRAP
jgi:hypothetical protein